MRFRKRIDSFLKNLISIKMGRTFSSIPFLYFMEEDYFFQVTDLQFWKRYFLNNGSHQSISNNFPYNILTAITFQKNQINRIFQSREIQGGRTGCFALQ